MILWHGQCCTLTKPLNIALWSITPMISPHLLLSLINFNACYAQTKGCLLAYLGIATALILKPLVFNIFLWLYIVTTGKGQTGADTGTRTGTAGHQVDEKDQQAGEGDCHQADNSGTGVCL